MKRIPFVYVILYGWLMITLHSSCQQVDAQTVSSESQDENSEARPAGPDGNPVTYDENPDNLPQSPLWTYINADGREVQNPTAYQAPPPDASAICRNGEYSFSKRRCGTCSGNGGVKEWLKKDLPKC